MSVFIGEVATFKELPDDPREQATKILEEAAEVFSAVESGLCCDPRLNAPGNPKEVIEECADVILATANLLACYGVDDLTEAIKRKIELNEHRGYVYEKEEERERKHERVFRFHCVGDPCHCLSVHHGSSV